MGVGIVILCVPVFTKPSRRKDQVNKSALQKARVKGERRRRSHKTPASGGSFPGRSAGSPVPDGPSGAGRRRQALVPRPGRRGWSPGAQRREAALNGGAGVCWLPAGRPVTSLLSQPLSVQVWVGTLRRETSRKVLLSLWGCDSWFLKSMSTFPLGDYWLCKFICFKLIKLHFGIGYVGHNWYAVTLICEKQSRKSIKMWRVDIL